LLPILLALQYFDRGQMSAADEFSDMGIKMAPEPNQQVDSETAAAWWLRGLIDYGQDNYVAAERSFRVALEADPNFEKAREALAWLMLYTKRRKDAVREITNLANRRHKRLKKMSLQERRFQE